jgi:putative ABC transport system permease protein
MEGDDLAAMLLIEVFALMLLVLVCGNVALLLFARAATREGEIIVRSALGASRRRIVVQLFAEALVLGGVAAAVGLAAARVALSLWGLSFLEANLGRVPFWYDPRLSPLTVLYACALTVLGAAIAGGLPGLKVTRGLGTRLREGTAGGGGLQFGGVWTAVIVAQVAVTVAFPASSWSRCGNCSGSGPTTWVRGRGVPGRAARDGCDARCRRGRRQRGGGGPARAVRDGARDAASARRG